MILESSIFLIFHHQVQLSSSIILSILQLEIWSSKDCSLSSPACQCQSSTFFSHPLSLPLLLPLTSNLITLSPQFQFQLLYLIRWNESQGWSWWVLSLRCHVGSSGLCCPLQGSRNHCLAHQATCHWWYRNKDPRSRCPECPTCLGQSWNEDRSYRWVREEGKNWKRFGRRSLFEEFQQRFKFERGI